MKSTEYLKGLRAKSAQQLKEELAALRREQFSLRMQSGMGQLGKPHLFGQVRQKIAQIKTVARERELGIGGAKKDAAVEAAPAPKAKKGARK